MTGVQTCALPIYLSLVGPLGVMNSEVSKWAEDEKNRLINRVEYFIKLWFNSGVLLGKQDFLKEYISLHFITT